MECPACRSSTKVLSTRDAKSYNAWLGRIAEQYPLGVFRRRACGSCSWRGYTIEVALTAPLSTAVEERVNENTDQCDSLAAEA